MACGTAAQERGSGASSSSCLRKRPLWRRHMPLQLRLKKRLSKSGPGVLRCSVILKLSRTTKWSTAIAISSNSLEAELVLNPWSCENIGSSDSSELRFLNRQQKTRVERAFRLVERALKRTLLAGKNRVFTALLQVGELPLPKRVSAPLLFQSSPNFQPETHQLTCIH